MRTEYKKPNAYIYNKLLFITAQFNSLSYTSKGFFVKYLNGFFIKTLKVWKSDQAKKPPQ